MNPIKIEKLKGALPSLPLMSPNLDIHDPRLLGLGESLRGELINIASHNTHPFNPATPPSGGGGG